MSTTVNRTTTVKTEAFGRIGVIFFHGSGGDGKELRNYVDQLPMPDLDLLTFRQVLAQWTKGHHESSSEMMKTTSEVYFPTAERRAYSPLGGEDTHVWFDRSPNFHLEGMHSDEDSKGILQSMRHILAVIAHIEEKEGFEHYFVGGFSMGGGFALNFLRHLEEDIRKQLQNVFTDYQWHLLNTFQHKIRGIFTMGSFLVQDSAVNDFKHPIFHPNIPVIMCHGTHDSLINIDWGKKTAANLLVREINVDFETFEGVDHEISPDEVSSLDSCNMKCL